MTGGLQKAVVIVEYLDGTTEQMSFMGDFDNGTIDPLMLAEGILKDMDRFSRVKAMAVKQ